MRLRPFRQVDVFTAEPYKGNPLAVVLDGAGLSTDEMQSIADWTNLSETTFVVPAESPDADYRVRIFTRDTELPFAGHPTLGTCHAWLQQGGVPRSTSRVVQECGIGLVTIRRSGEGLAFAAPASGPVRDRRPHRGRAGHRPARRRPPPTSRRGVGRQRTGVDRRAARRCRGRPGAAARLRRRTPPRHRCRRIPPAGVGVRHRGAGVLRCGERTGGGSGHRQPQRLGRAVAARQRPARCAVRRCSGHLPRTSRRVHVERDDDGTIWIGGSSTTCIAGTIEA